MHQLTRIDKERRLVFLISNKEKQSHYKQISLTFFRPSQLTCRSDLRIATPFKTDKIRKPNPLDELIIALDLKLKICYTAEKNYGDGAPNT